MKTKRSSTRLLCYVLCVLLLSSSMFLTGAVPADVSVGDALPLIATPAEANAVSSGRERNIIWRVKVGLQDSVDNSISFTVSYNSSFLRLCTGVKTSTELSCNGSLSTTVNVNDTYPTLNDIFCTYTGRYICGTATVSGVTLPAGYYRPRYDDVLLECRFVSDYDLNPQHFLVSNANGHILSTQSIIIGDLNEDGTVNSVDSDLVLQHVVGGEDDLLDTEDYKYLRIAADVNQDGNINNIDALLISQYSGGVIQSFWSDYSPPSSLPTAPTEGIVDGEVYSFQNDYNDNGFAGTGSASGTVLPQARYYPNNALQQFYVFYKGNGEYEIQRKNNTSLVLSMNSNNQLIQETRTSSASSSQRWYIVRNSDGTYILINKAAPTRCLTVAGKSNSNSSVADSVSIGTSSVGNRWRLCRDVGRTSYDYYDASFALRYETGTVLHEPGAYNLVLNEHPLRIISDSRAAATKVFGTLLGVSIKYGNVVAYETPSDACRVANGAGLLSTYQCTSSESGHTHGTRYGVTVYCTDHWGQFSKFKADYPLSSISNRMNTLWSGAYLYKEGTTTQYNRSYTQAASSSHNGSGYTHIIRLGSDGNNVSGLTSTYVHEISHRFGARDHYHEINADGDCKAGLAGICSDVNCESFSDLPEDAVITPRPKKCEMYESYWFWKADSVKDLYCEGCLIDMQNYLIDHYSVSAD